DLTSTLQHQTPGKGKDGHRPAEGATYPCWTGRSAKHDRQGPPERRRRGPGPGRARLAFGAQRTCTPGALGCAALPCFSLTSLSWEALNGSLQIPTPAQLWWPRAGGQAGWEWQDGVGSDASLEKDGNDTAQSTAEPSSKDMMKW
ncbi:hypothetical protein P7K49_035587, partial [Saguinus oedipus]